MKRGIFEEPKVHCWRTQHELRIRQPPTPTSVEIDFSTRLPNFWGCLSEMRLLGKEQAAALNLPLIEIEVENPNLKDRRFEAPGVYLIRIKFGEFQEESPGGARRVSDTEMPWPPILTRYFWKNWIKSAPLLDFHDG
jgi:hypothetical protein